MVPTRHRAHTRRTVLLGLVGGSVLAALDSYTHTQVSAAAPIPGLPDGPIPDTAAPVPAPLAPPPADPAALAAKYATAIPHERGTAVSGVHTRLAAAGRRIALTIDACGGPNGSDVDNALIALLNREQIPATFFLNGRWIDANPAVTAQLAANPLFELANHGTRHLPLSVTGKSAYTITDTRSAAEVVDEVLTNHHRLNAITGTPPRWFRPGTAHCDDVAAALVRGIGEQVVGFTVNGDAGATLSPAAVHSALTTANPRVHRDPARQPPRNRYRRGPRVSAPPAPSRGNRVRHPHRCRRPGTLRTTPHPDTAPDPTQRAAHPTRAATDCQGCRVEHDQRGGNLDRAAEPCAPEYPRTRAAPGDIDARPCQSRVHHLAHDSGSQRDGRYRYTGMDGRRPARPPTSATGDAGTPHGTTPRPRLTIAPYPT
ncbi:polysaccharide deacetylase family protein [Rhodococcus jostii]|uniref:polysaccharide deacetylase family protein n=1 Tax=Rhodococcus jostii TaxID=132919 RepID=UPI000681E7A2|nr:polysaccharide deacetylase family protein [Rhodococcus jostii]